MIQFTAKGHKNILSTHKNTLEFTHDKHLTLNGDCIIGINANYELDKIKQQKFKRVKITITIDNIKDEIIADCNPEFRNPHEMVIRKSNYLDQRTFAINADKSAKDIKRELVKKMQNSDAELAITLEHIGM